MAFTFEETGLPGVLIVLPQVHGDSRGYFMETYRREPFAAVGIRGAFVQDNESFSRQGVLRGLHFQREHTQGKLVRVTQGEVFDVAVDLRPGSGTFGKWVGVTLTAEKKNMLYIPEGFAHGFLVLSETAAFAYKCTDVYDPASEGGIPWDDKDIGVAWPRLACQYIVSEKDGRHPAFAAQDFSWAAKYEGGKR